MKYLMLLFIALAPGFLWPPPAQADKVTVRVCKPNQGPKARCVQAAELKKRVAPVKVKIEGTIARLSARIIGFERGARAGDPLEPANHDRLKLQVYSAGGKTVAKAPWVLSTFRIYQVYHHFDTLQDLRYYFSNRHVIAKSEFGGAQHRDLIYGLVDPTGDMELYQGAKLPASRIVEGGYTNYIRHGLGNVHGLYNKWTQSQSDPYTFSMVAGNLFSLATVARARRYSSIFPAGLDKKFLKVYGMLCSLTQADPLLAETANAGAAKRGNELGQKCRRMLHTHLSFAMIRRSRDLYYMKDKVLPVSRREVVMAVLDLMLAEKSFQIHPWAQPMVDGSVYLSGKMPGEPNIDLMAYLLEIIAGPRHPASARKDFSNDAEIVAKGRRLFEKFAFRKAGESDAAAQALALDRRYFKRTLFRALWKLQYGGSPATWADKPVRMAASLLCSNGWGLAADMKPVIDKLIRAYYTQKTARGVGAWLGLINATADAETRAHLRQKLEVVYQRQKQLLRGTKDARSRRWLAGISDMLAGLKNPETKALCK